MNYFDAKIKQLHTKNTPLISIFELTYHCNFTCTHCYADFRLQRRELELEDYKEIFKDFRKMGILHLGFTGGEVFTKKNVHAILEEAKRQRFAIRILTNGYFIDDEQIKFLNHISPTAIEISFYSHIESVFENITKKPGSYQKVLNAITNLAKNDHVVYAKSPIFNSNVAHLNDTELFVQKLGALPLYDPLLTPTDCSASSPINLRTSNEELLAYYQTKTLKPSNRYNDHMCSVGRSAFAVSPYGDVFPCIQIKKAIGNLKTHAIEHIWNTAPFLNQLRGTTFKTTPKCSVCDMTEHCSPCMGVNLIENNDLMKPSDEHCRLTSIRKAAYESQIAHIN